MHQNAYADSVLCIIERRIMHFTVIEVNSVTTFIHFNVTLIWPNASVIPLTDGRKNLINLNYQKNGANDDSVGKSYG